MKTYFEIIVWPHYITREKWNCCLLGIHGSRSVLTTIKLFAERDKGWRECKCEKAFLFRLIKSFYIVSTRVYWIVWNIKLIPNQQKKKNNEKTFFTSSTFLDDVKICVSCGTYSAREGWCAAICTIHPND